MFYREHVPPHFHAEYQGQQAKFGLDAKKLPEISIPERLGVSSRSGSRFIVESLRAIGRR